jgi:ATP-binding cassette subfamily B protein
MLRLLEPLGAPEHSEASDDNADRLQPADKDATYAAEVQTIVDEPAQPLGIAIALEGVHLTISGRIILNKFDLRIDSGSHVAIVGPSGAGKSSLVGLLLGWCRPSGGRILIDGIPLNGERLKRLREETAWIDPSLQLWNRSLIDNLNYGASPESIASLGEVVEMAELRELLETLPDGLQTHLGEGGALVSGGEGQRVRLGRAMQRRDARLVILDEPFTGLARPQRERLLLRARALWQNATLLYVTHSIDEAAAFERVLVLDAANIIEDGAPNSLRQQETSRYRAMWESERAVRKGFMTSENWRRLRVETGQLTEIGRWAKRRHRLRLGAVLKEQPPAFN